VHVPAGSVGSTSTIASTAHAAMKQNIDDGPKGSTADACTMQNVARSKSQTTREKGKDKDKRVKAKDADGKGAKKKRQRVVLDSE